MWAEASVGLRWPMQREDKTLRVMREEEESLVRRLCAEIDHGAWLADRPPGWHREHSTVVAERDGRIVGYTTYLIRQGCMVGLETCVTGEYRGRGIGRALMEYRLAVAQRLNCQIVTGGVREDHEVMVHLLESLGLHACQRVPQGYGPDPMMVYARHLHMENT